MGENFKPAALVLDPCHRHRWTFCGWHISPHITIIVHSWFILFYIPTWTSAFNHLISQHEDPGTVHTFIIFHSILHPKHSTSTYIDIPSDSHSIRSRRTVTAQPRSRAVGSHGVDLHGGKAGPLLRGPVAWADYGIFFQGGYFWGNFHVIISKIYISDI